MVIPNTSPISIDNIELKTKLLDSENSRPISARDKSKKKPPIKTNARII
jgi:hypothetical protein